MAITELPNPPSRSDPANFSERADTFMAALPAFAQEANALQTDVNNKQRSIAEDADAASTSAQQAGDSLLATQQAATAAANSAQGAADKAGAAADSAARSKDWAAKIGGAVEGGEFSAKHYAQQAAAGAGLPIYAGDSVPHRDVGSIFIRGQGPAEWDDATGRYRVLSQIPVGAIDWWSLRTSIPAGKIPLDGQTVSRAMFPDLVAMVIAGSLPIVAESTWQSDPLQRGKYTLGDGSTTIRLPDFNGQSAGSLGALFLRGDGAFSAGADGVIQRDATQRILGGIYPIQWANNVPQVNGPFALEVQGAGSMGTTGAASGFSRLMFDSALVTRTASESRPTNATGIWVVNAFGAVTNPGSVDAAQLASNLAALSSEVQNLASFAILYPGGGNAAAPGNVSKATRYVTPSPFPGSYLICQVQLLYNGLWASPGGFFWTANGGGFGTFSAQANDTVVTQTGDYKLMAAPGAGGSPHNNANVDGPLPARVLVWKLKGDAQ